MKLVIFAMPLLAVVVCANASAGVITLGSAADFSVVSNTYTFGGDGSIVYGNVIAKNYATTDNGSTIHGNFRSGDVLTLGDGTTVKGHAQSIEAGTATANTIIDGNFEVGGVGTMGDTSNVKGNFISGLDGTIGAKGQLDGNWEVGAGSVATASASSNKLTSDAVDTNATYLNGVKQGITNDMFAATNDLVAAKNMLNAMASTEPTLAATFTTNGTLFAGVYDAASWSTTASTVIELDGQDQDNAMWVFNIEDILKFGGRSTIKLVNVGINAQVLWNVGHGAGGYANLGDGADIVGTIIADDYVEVGANAFVRSASVGNCAGVYSTTSYVSVGANGVVGGAGCLTALISPVTVPAPGAYSIFLAGLGLMGFIMRKRAKKAA
jgi:hypothetical protein